MKRRTFLGFLSTITFGLFGTKAKAAPPPPAELSEPVKPAQGCFDDWNTMVHAIKTHVQQTGDTILNSDDPMARTIGFVAYHRGQVYETGRWHIPLTALKESRDTMPEAHRTAITTAAGRAKLAYHFELSKRA